MTFSDKIILIILWSITAGDIATGNAICTAMSAVIAMSWTMMMFPTQPNESEVQR